MLNIFQSFCLEMLIIFYLSYVYQMQFITFMHYNDNIEIGWRDFNSYYNLYIYF